MNATLWKGKRVDPTGLIYLGTRYYDPALGRFISCDPLGHGATPDLYSYAQGNPLLFHDLDGRFASAVYDHIAPISLPTTFS